MKPQTSRVALAMRAMCVFTLLVLVAGALADQQIDDDVFDPGNWYCINRGHGSFVESQRIGEGFCVNARAIVVSGSTGVQPEIWCYYIGEGYDPKVNGPIETIAWEIWNLARQVDWVGVIRVIARQGDSEYIYLPSRWEPPLFPYPNWQKASGTIPGDGFVKAYGSGPARLDFGPDAPSIYFGYVYYIDFNHSFSQVQHWISCFHFHIRCAAPQLTALTLDPNEVFGGVSSTGTVTLNRVAPAGGVTIALSSCDTNIATVPATVTIPEGQTSADFTVNTNAVSQDTNVCIEGEYNGTATATLTVKKQTVFLAKLTFSRNPIRGGLAGKGWVTLTAPSPSGGVVVTLTNTNPAANLLVDEITIPAGQTHARFQFTTTPVYILTKGMVTATLGISSLSKTLKVRP